MTRAVFEAPAEAIIKLSAGDEEAEQFLVNYLAKVRAGRSRVVVSGKVFFTSGWVRRVRARVTAGGLLDELGQREGSVTDRLNGVIEDQVLVDHCDEFVGARDDHDRPFDFPPVERIEETQVWVRDR